MKTINTMGLSRQNAGFLRFWTIALLFLAVFALGAWVPVALAGYDGKETEFDVADIYFELNNTDEDLGIHALIDGEAWKYLAMEDPNGRKMLNVFVRGRLHRQGLTEIFFESAEPTFDELDPEDFFRRFPEGKYEIEGITLDWKKLESTDILTHLLPAPPSEIVISEVPFYLESIDCENEATVPEIQILPSEDIAISWEKVTQSHPELGRTNERINVVSYQVVVEVEVDETEMIYSVYLPPNVMEVSVPPEFIALGEEFKFEILVREESGNQTAVESCFTVEVID
jgi:hypothetical protein